MESPMAQQEPTEVPVTQQPEELNWFQRGARELAAGLDDPEHWLRNWFDQVVEASVFEVIAASEPLGPWYVDGTAVERQDADGVVLLPRIRCADPMAAEELVIYLNIMEQRRRGWPRWWHKVCGAFWSLREMFGLVPSA